MKTRKNRITSKNKQKKKKKFFFYVNKLQSSDIQSNINKLNPRDNKHKQQNQSSLKKQYQMITWLRQIESLEASSSKGSIPCKLMSPTSPKEVTFKNKGSNPTMKQN